MGKYVVGLIGGACAGSEMAARLVELGMEVVVFEQNPLPYGKIEDGLPRWHTKLQAKEKNNIDTKLDQDGVYFMPKCKLGTDITVEELVEEWRMPMVVMANGAWRDRPLRVTGADPAPEGLVYQNPFVFWFNHYHERNYVGTAYEVPPGPVVIGGGLASIDVAKICQYEMFKAAMAKRGHEVDVESFEHYGVYKVAEKHGVDYDELKIAPARIYYRKEVTDMPLVPLPEDADEARLEKAKKVREKLVMNGRTRYGFHVHPLRSPAEVIRENGRLTGVLFDVTKWEDGRLVKTGEHELVTTSLAISSIGSIPEPIRGVPMDGELYSWEDRFTGAVEGLPHFYCVGNAITGRGNIKDSTANAKRLAAVVASALGDETLAYEKWFRAKEEAARVHVEKMRAYLEGMPPTEPSQRENILARVRSHWERIGYTGYAGWRDEILAHR